MELDQKTIRDINSTVKAIKFSLASDRDTDEDIPDIVTINIIKRNPVLPSYIDMNEDPYYGAIHKIDGAISELLLAKDKTQVKNITFDMSNDYSTGDVHIKLTGLERFNIRSPEELIHELVRELRGNGIGQHVQMYKDDMPILNAYIPPDASTPQTDLDPNSPDYDGSVKEDDKKRDIDL